MRTHADRPLSPLPGIPAGQEDDALLLPPALFRELRSALSSIRYGAIELVIHDGRVVQLEWREKVRCDVELTDSRKP
jgi:hypothetical protein